MRHPDGHVLSIPVRIPASVRATAREIAERQGVSLNYFIMNALREKVVRMHLRHGNAAAPAGRHDLDAPLNH